MIALVKPAASEAWVTVSDGLPEDCRAVIAWDSDSATPCTAFFDAEERGWHAQADGTRFPDGVVTHWRHYVGPAGELSGDAPTMGAPITLPGADAGPTVIFTAPYSIVRIPVFDLDDHVGMRAGQLAALVRAIPRDDYPVTLMRMAAQLADELNGQLKNGQGEAALAGELAELLLRAQGSGPCDLLWLAQQIADEISAVVTAIARNENEGESA